MRGLRSLGWIAAALAGAGALAVIATARGEAISSAWFLIAALCCYALGYRFYSGFLARRVFALDDARATSACGARIWAALDPANPLWECPIPYELLVLTLVPRPIPSFRACAQDHRRSSRGSARSRRGSFGRRNHGHRAAWAGARRGGTRV